MHVQSPDLSGHWYADPPPLLRYRVLPVLTSTRVENYSLAAALTVIRAQRADHLPFSLEVMPASLVYTNFLSADF